MDAKQEFERLSSQSEADLLVEIGEAISSSSEIRHYRETVDRLNARVPRTERMKRLALQWLENNKSVFDQAICQNARVRKILSADPGTGIEAFKLVVDSIAAFKTTVPAATLAMLAMRKGIDWVCRPIGSN